MNKQRRKWMTILLSLLMVAMPLSSFAAEAAGEVEGQTTGETKSEQSAPAATAAEVGTVREAATAWEATDFTYGEWVLKDELYPADDTEKTLKGTIWVITGFSKDGTAKLAGNKDLVLPAADPDGRKVQGVGASAFYRKELTSVKFPKTEKVTNALGWPGEATRGDFFIGSSAFLGNRLTTLKLPEGVIYIGGNAFNNNQLTSVSFPKTVMLIANSAFAKNKLAKVNFPARTDFALNIDRMGFAVNQIKALQLPENTMKVTNQAFLQNTGMEPVTEGTVAEKKGGIVYMYKVKTSDPESFIDDTTNKRSATQKLIHGKQPITDTAWTFEDFAFDEAGTTVTGLTDRGKEKLKQNPVVVIPDENDEGVTITAIGKGVNGLGVFGYKDADGNKYVPTSVTFPKGLKEIGDFAFNAEGGAAQAGLTTLSLPGGLEKIGLSAFANNPLTEVTLPDSVKEIGKGCFSGNEANPVRIKTLTLCKGLKEIPQAAFVGQEIGTVVIPEGVETIGPNAFMGNFVTTLTLSGTVTKIDANAFRNHALESLEIPASVKSVGKQAFQIYTEGKPHTLKTLILHEGLTEIADKAFASSLLDSTDLPTTVTTLSKTAFDGNTVNGSAQKVVLYSSVEAQAKGEGEYAKVVPEGSGHKIEYKKVTYAVTVENGTADPQEAGEGETVTITAGAAPAGQKFKNWTVKEGDVTVALQ